MEKQPMKIGDQEFKRVGEMKSEDTELKHAPKSFDLYQDTQDGALMGKLPENHPSAELTQENEMHERLEAVDIDLTNLTTTEAYLLLTSSERMAPKDYGFKIYGKINKGNEKEEELSIYTRHHGSSTYYDVMYKKDLEIFNKNSEGMVPIGSNGIPYPEREDESGDITNAEINPKYVTIAGKNSLIIGSENGRVAEVSFLEIPKAYTEMMKEKEGKAE